MKNKVLAVALLVVLVVSICSIPLLAGWEGYTPNFGYTESDIALFGDENLRSSYSTMEFISLVDNAYELGLFGGAYPVAVILSYADGLYQPVIICASPVSADGNLDPIEKITLGSIYGAIDNTIYCTNQNLLISTWLIVPTGDIACAIGILTGFPLSSDETEKLYLLRNTDKTDGVNGWYWDDNDSNFAQFYNVDGNVNNSIVEINELYEMALQNYIPPTPEPDPDPEPEPEPEPVPPIINNFTYLLDIPSIITAIPNGAKQIIQHSLDFDIFGINVAGLLSVLIVVALVSLGVKWLMSR